MCQTGISGIPCFLDHVYLSVDGRPSMIFLLPLLLTKLPMETFSMLQIKRKISSLYQGKRNLLFPQ